MAVDVKRWRGDGVEVIASIRMVGLSNVPCLAGFNDGILSSLRRQMLYSISSHLCTGIEECELKFVVGRDDI